MFLIPKRHSLKKLLLIKFFEKKIENKHSLPKDSVLNMYNRELSEYNFELLSFYTNHGEKNVNSPLANTEY